MTKGIVDHFELIKVEIQQGVRLFRVGAQGLHRRDQSILELTPVNQISQRVVRRLVAELTEQSGLLAHIMEHHHRTDDITDTVTNRRRRILNRNFLAVLVDQYRVFLERNHAFFFQAAHYRVLDGGTRVLIDDRHDFGNRAISHTAHIETGQVLRHGIDVVDYACRIRGYDAVTDGLQCNLCALFFFKDSRLSAFTLCDVSDRAFMSHDHAVVVVNGAGVLENDDFAAVLTAQPILEILYDALCFQAREHAFPVDRIDV